MRRAVDSEPLRQAHVELGPRRHAVQTEIAAEIELQVRAQRVGQRFIQGIDEFRKRGSQLREILVASFVRFLSRWHTISYGILL